MIPKEGFDIMISCTGRPRFRDLMEVSWILSWFYLGFPNLGCANRYAEDIKAL